MSHLFPAIFVLVRCNAPAAKFQHISRPSSGFWQADMVHILKYG
jgi:hypothetical protein